MSHCGVGGLVTEVNARHRCGDPDEAVRRARLERDALLSAGALVFGVTVTACCDDGGNGSELSRIGYVVGDTTAPLFAVLIITAAIGALIGWLLLRRPHRRQD